MPDNRPPSELRTGEAGADRRSATWPPVVSNLTTSEHRLLALVLASGPQPIEVLAESLSQNRATVAAFVDRLARRGLLIRVSSADEPACTVVTLSTGGRLVADDLVGAAGLDPATFGL